MVRTTPPLIAALAVGLLTACSASTGTTSPTPTAAATAAATDTQSPSAVASAVPTSTDPCQVLTASEASSLSGVSYTAGREETTSGGGKVCVYGYQTLNIFWVLVGEASDAATAQAQFTQEEAQAESFLTTSLPQGANANATLTDATIAGADKAAVGSGSAALAGHTFSFSDLAALKGPSFLFFSNVSLGQSVASSSALETQAATSISRLP
jgi:hypothetical protein